MNRIAAFVLVLIATTCHAAEWEQTLASTSSLRTGVVHVSYPATCWSATAANQH